MTLSLAQQFDVRREKNDMDGVRGMNVGVLGAGGMGFSVIGHLQECEGVDTIVAYDIDNERIRLARDKFGIAAAPSLRDVLCDPGVRLVFITASNETHKDLALQALEAGKAVMCEKPMGLTQAEARAMVEAAERHNGFLQIGFEARYCKLYGKVKQWIDAGLLGEIVNTHCFYIASSWPKGTWRNGAACGSMFGEKLSHYVDLPRWWTGAELKDVYTVCAPNVVNYLECRDNYHTTYRFTTGAVNHLTFMMGPAQTFKGDPLQDVLGQQLGDGHALRYLVVGTRGAAEADVFGRSIKRWEFGDAPEHFTSDLVETLAWKAEEDHYYFHNTCDQTKDIVRRVARGLPPMTSPRDSYETMRLCFAAEESARRGAAIEMDEFEP